MTRSSHCKGYAMSVSLCTSRLTINNKESSLLTCLLAHLTLIHVPWRLVIIRKWGETCNKTEHVGRVQFLVGCDSFSNILGQAGNIHEPVRRGAKERKFL